MLRPERSIDGHHSPPLRHRPRDAIRLSFDTKVTGPPMLAKHLAPRMSASGSFTLFSGVAAAKIAVGTLGVAITNAAADTLTRSLAWNWPRSGSTPSPPA